MKPGKYGSTKTHFFGLKLKTEFNSVIKDPEKKTTKDILALLQILFHIPSNRSMGLAELLFGICRNGSRLEMYDVNFGGTKHMTKRLTFALVAVAMFVLLAIMPVSALNYPVAQNITNSAATVFIGESGLNLTKVQIDNWYTVAQATSGTTNLRPGDSTIGWWASAASISSTAPTKTISLVGRNTSFTVAPSDFVGFTGNWYFTNGSTTASPVPFFTVADPTLAIAPWDSSLSSGNDQSGKSVIRGQYLQFKVDTNMYAAINAPLNRGPTAASQGVYFDDNHNLYGVINDGYVDIKVKDASGATLSKLVNGSFPGQFANNLTRQNVSYQPWYWGIAASTNNLNAVSDLTPATTGLANWSTGALDINGQYVYAPGTYTITAESWLNGMKDNYKNAGADYTGKTVSAATTITLVSDSIKIEANKDSVVRSKPFSVTVTGKPLQAYHMWIKGTASMKGGYDDQPPMLTLYQSGVAQDPFNAGLADTVSQLYGVYAPGLAGNYSIQNGGEALGNNVWSQVASGDLSTATVAAYKAKLGNGTYLYANVTTANTGVRTVEWQTTNWTKAQKYTIRVEQQFAGTTQNNVDMTTNPSGDIANKFKYATGTYFSDEVDVKVEKGAVTIVAAGSQSYYLGEEIKFSGTNTETYTTYLFIMGPNLKPAGSKISDSNPRDAKVTTGDASTFQSASVLSDNTWSWKWGTSAVALDAGTYTIYAVSQPNNYDDLKNSAFGTVSIIIKKPFVSATASQSTVAQGDKVFITGTAEGQPTLGVKIWVLGKNYPTTVSDVKTQSVNADSSFKYEITQSATKNLYPGQYFVVVQHPMQNNIFDISMCTGAGLGNVVCNNQANGGLATAKVFTLLGSGSLQGSDAAEALVQGINSPNVDDTYTKLQFLVEVPVIRIDPVGDKHVGDKFTITASTNLAVDDEVLVQVYSSSFKPTQKSQSGEFSGATGTVKVKKGDSGMNKITFDVDSSTFKPDEYIVTANAILQVATGTALFNVLEGAAPVVTTKAPVVVTTVAPVVTTAAPVVTTVPPTPVPTKSPGYGALIALIGLGAVAFIVVRRH